MSQGSAHEGWVEGEAVGVRGEWRKPEDDDDDDAGVWSLFLENVQQSHKGRYFCKVSKQDVSII